MKPEPQPVLFQIEKPEEKTHRPDTVELLPLDEYDLVKVDLSGGKDSVGAVLRMLKLGVPKHKMELWHHPVDGNPYDEDFFFDWRVTTAYCRAFAQAIGIPIRFQWREGGLKRELLKVNDRLAPVTFELGDGTLKTVGGVKGKISSRRRWPQVSADLKVRWCSGVAKIDVCSMAMSNDPRLLGKKILELTGERREESANRATYAEKEPHRTSNSKRRVDHWRCVIDLTEREIWDLLREFRVRPHPAYFLGFGRVSCMLCIFGLPDQWATIREIDPERFYLFVRLEQEFGFTINRKRTLLEMADKGTSYLPELRKQGVDVDGLVKLATGTEYSPDMIFIPESQPWILPAGAFRNCGGPS